jgi:hypothetical protein
VTCFVDDFRKALPTTATQMSSGRLVHALLFVASAIIGWFVTRDATNFGVLQMFWDGGPDHDLH